jgi:hypothetical protein
MQGLLVRTAFLGLTLLVGQGHSGLRAEEILTISNHSFEAPETPFVTLVFDSWERFPKPDGYVEEGGFLWNQLTGTFANSAPGSVDHLENLKGRQSMWVFAVPDNGVWQRVRTSDGLSAAQIQAGDTYRLTVDLLGGGGAMRPSVPISLRLQAVGEGMARSTIASFSVTNSLELFPVRTRMRTFEFTSAPVPMDHPAIGMPLAIEVRSMVSPELEGGYWNVDALQLVRVPVVRPELTLVRSENGIRLGWQSIAGWRYRLYRAEQLGMDAPYGTELTGTGVEMALEVPLEPETNAFFRLHGWPSQ